jgi:hypothetical protein
MDNIKMKKVFGAIALTAALTLGLGTTPPPASAGVPEAGQFVKENWRWIVSNLWTPSSKSI